MSESQTQTVDDEPTETETESETETETEETPGQSADLTTDSGGFSCIAEASTLEEFFETFYTLMDEMKLHLDTDGLYAIGVDPANIASAEDSLDKEAFEHYSSTGGLIGLDLSRMIDILSFADAGDLAKLELDQETRKLHIEIESLEYTLALIDPDAIRAEPDLPDLDLPGVVTLEASDLSRAITAADMVSDHIRFRIAESEDGDPMFIAEAAGDTDDVVLEVVEDELVAIEAGDADSLFSLDYLEDIAKAVPKDAAVTLRLGEEFPMFLEFEHCEVDEETHAEALFMLAPRITKE